MAEQAAVRRRLPPLLLTRRSRWLVTCAYVLIAVVVVADLVTGPHSTFSPLLAAVPVLAATSTRKAWVPLLSGVVAVVVVGILALLNNDVPTVVHVTAAVTVLAVTFTSTATVVLVTARERELATVRTVAEAAQQALLRPVPPRVGGLRVAVRYMAAAAEAKIGGDLYEVVQTPFGVRVFLGDVRGNGLAAVNTAADVLGVFRDAALSEPDLADVAGRLDAALARRPQTRDQATAEFVTAVLLTFPDERQPAEIVNCGHPPPLIRREGRVTEVRPPAYCPPLALLGMVGGRYPVSPLRLDDDGMLLLYTDGVSEARDEQGRFYPLAPRLALMPESDPDALLERLLRDVTQYAGGGLGDDAAVLAVCRETAHHTPSILPRHVPGHRTHDQD
ncbi:PP2C family protein-serine/threonine phosphatase [Streptantibioticus parmotrematis]|uniref:PP2C family protein-serine/threonine phosphatase n=1 Tax=Streptantibioticus parmotrematis TaxID=2873249 RepID=UPI0033E46476